MAIRIESGEGLVRTTGLLDYNSPYTFMGWFYTDSVTNYGTYWNLWAGSYQNQDALHRNALGSDVSLEVWSGGSGTGSAYVTIPLNTWQHLAIVRESNTSCKLYIDGVLQGTNTTNITGRTAITEMRVGVTTVDLDGRAAYLKAWQGALTASEVASEMHAISPRRFQDLYAYWPTLSDDLTTDRSGNSRNFTAVGTLSEVLPPPVGWGGKVFVLTPSTRVIRTLPTILIPLVVPAPTISTGAASRTLTPSPVAVNFATTTPRIRRTLIPSPVAVNFTPVAPRIRRTLIPAPVTIPILTPAPTVTLGAGTKTPQPVAITFRVNPTPLTLVKGPISKTPSPVAINFVPVAPTIRRVKTLTPSPVTVPIATTTPTLVKTKILTPVALALPFVANNVTLAQGARTLRPDPVTISIVPEVPTIVGFFEFVTVDQILVDWNQDGDFTDPGEDITGYVRAWVMDRGRDTPNALSGKAMAGRMELLLDNRDGRFSEFNTTGPYFGSLHNGVPIRLMITTPAAGVQFEGKLENIQPTSSLGGNHTAQLIAYGPLGAFGQDAAGGSGSNINTELYNNVYTSDAIGYILDAANWPAGKRLITSGGQPLVTWWADGANPLTALRELEDIEQGFIYESKDGKIVWENRYERYSLTSKATYSDTEGSPLSYQPLQSLSPSRTIVNEVEVVVEPPTASAGDLKVLWTGIPPITLAPGESVQVIAVADLLLDPGAFGVSSWTTPSGAADFVAWTSPDATGTNMTAWITATAVKQATRMYITYTNTHATLTLYLTYLAARGRLAIKHNQVVVSVKDMDSQQQYGRRTRTVQGGKYLADRSTAKAIASLILEQHKVPHPAFQMPFTPMTPTQLISALSLDISDRITLEASVNGTGFGVNADFIIESIHLEMPADRILRVRFGLSPQEIYFGSGGEGQDFFTLDTSVLDGPDILGF